MVGVYDRHFSFPSDRSCNLYNGVVIVSQFYNYTIKYLVSQEKFSIEYLILGVMLTRINSNDVFINYKNENKKNKKDFADKGRCNTHKNFNQYF